MANESSLLQEHSGKLVSGFFMLCGTVLVGMSKWLVGREVERIDKKFDDHSQRLHSLELNVATKEDLREIRQTMTEQHGQLLEAIMSTRGDR